jgi:formylglycine-generating enzyme required for sulfatase activity
MSRKFFIPTFAVAVTAMFVAALIPAPEVVPVTARDAINADHRSYTEAIPGSMVKFDMVAVPGGTYVIGSPDAEAGRGTDEGPQRPITIRPFWIGKHEVTWDEFDLFWKTEVDIDPNNPPPPEPKGPDASTFPTPPYVDPDYNHRHEGHPALCMTQHCAMEYCRWLSKRTGKIYRLPTEAEWEYACRAGSKSAYSFGDDAAKLEEYGWYKKNSPDDDHARGTTHKVGSLKPNAWGIHDMHGNVTEWCVDHYQKDIYSTYPIDKPMVSPVLLPTARRWSHVTRGGSWADGPEMLRSAARRASDPSWMKHDPQEPKSIWWLTKMDVIGMRLVRAVEEQDNLKGLRSKVTKASE